MRSPNRRLLELDPQRCESSKWSWLDDVVQPRSPRFGEEVEQGALGRSWVFLCAASGLREPGEFFTDEIAGRLVLICRTQEGVLRGFRNVCPHLGAPVERNRCGQTRTFICPYHAWTFSLDGRLASMPLPEGYEGSGFRKEEFGLPEIPTASVGSLVFGSLGNNPNSPASHVGAAAPYLEGLFPASAQWDLIFNCTIRVDLGWEEWAQRTRRAYAEGTMAAAFLGITQAEYGRHLQLVQTPQGHQIVLVRDVDFAGLGRRYHLTTQGWGTGRARFLQEQGLTGCMVHLVPNLLVAGVGDALVTLRADPLDAQISLIRILGYGARGEAPALRQARLHQLQLWWGPYAEQLRMVMQEGPRGRDLSAGRTTP
jgi:nitrite reductase/ring-hydroxylating ferredoxin subunit